MKRILFICALLITASITQLYAGRPILASKATFTARVSDLNNDIAAGKITAANAAMNDLDTMMFYQVGYSKYKISDAIAASDVPGTTAAQKGLQTKWSIYNNLSMYTNDVVKNQTVINTYLSNFMAIMD